MNRITNRWFIRIMTVAALLFTGSTAAGDYGSLNPAAPEETRQFEFIVGNWQCATRFMDDEGNYHEGEARWEGFYMLDGWAIKDIWHSTLPDGNTFQGINIRSFNPETKKWDNRWLPQYTLAWKYYESEMVGNTMVMTGGAGSDENGDFIERNTFYDIEADSWKWRKDRSYDGGNTWIEGLGFIEATRIRK